MYQFGVLKHSRWDAVLVFLALLHGSLLLSQPGAVLIAIGIWWNSNTVAHNFIHNPFFRGRMLNSLFRLYLSLLLGFPQTLWRERHLAHHAGRDWKLRISGTLFSEILLVLGLWLAMLEWNSRFFFVTYLPGYLMGLGLCFLQGHYEHARGTLSHYGGFYNLVFFNDGFHCEHHEYPGRHWTELSRGSLADASTSGWPPVLRWLETPWLELLERVVLRCRALQRFVLSSHRRAFQSLLEDVPNVRRIAIVGGGLFPRTVLILHELLPSAELVVIEANKKNLEIARSMTDGAAVYVHDHYTPRQPIDFDLLVIPLSFHGDRNAIYLRPPAPRVLVHDWIWNRRGDGTTVSLLLLKRLNLVQP